jgi:hypothetical protein
VKVGGRCFLVKKGWELTENWILVNKSGFWRIKEQELIGNCIKSDFGKQNGWKLTGN